jgi:hypothetical protein
MTLPSLKPLNFNQLDHQATITVSLALGKGSLSAGFPYVTAQIWSQDSSLPQQFTGSLPSNFQLAETLQQWEAVYLALSERLQMGNRSLDEDDDDDFEIEEDAVTHVSIVSFEEVTESLQRQLNQWLLNPEFASLERSLRAQLDTSSPIRIILQGDEEDSRIQKLPWQSWQLLTDYPLAEIALSQSEFKRSEVTAVAQPRKQVRILAILGNSQGIDLAEERYLLEQIPDAEVHFLTQPSRQEFDRSLWDDQGWDILFFAGHSQTEKKTGRLYLQDSPNKPSVTITHLKEALTEAIAKGLQLAIFNSCDGLGLANSLADLHIPTTIVMSEPVPNLVAQQFFQHFLKAYSQEQLPLYLAVKKARRQLQGLENDYPGASLLPVIWQNPAILPPTWLELGGLPPCPYKGLNAFGEEDANLYYGRETLREELATKLIGCPLLPILGASGSGKSSFVFAGLIPQLKSDTRCNWLIESFRPESNPLQSLAIALQKWDATIDVNQLSEEFLHQPESLRDCLENIQSKLPTNSRLLLVIDQFEEVYTLASSESGQKFLQLLVKAIDIVPKFSLLLTMRADFLAQVLEFEPWGQLWQKYEPEFLLPLSTEELERAITIPAVNRGVKFESGLLTQIIKSVQGKVGYLPLLQFALTQFWSLQEKGILTDSAYQKLGGVYSALVDYAEDIYARMKPEQRGQTQQLLLQLVQVNQNAEATRKVVSKTDIQDWDLALYLTSKRLLTTNRHEEGLETIEIVHEALIYHWQRLKDWIRDNEDFLRWQNRLQIAWDEWQKHNCSAGYLLLEAPLVEAELWLDKKSDSLTAEQKFFINLSIDDRDRLEKEEAQRKEKELQQEKKVRKATQKIAIATSLSLIMTILAGGWTWWERQRSLRVIERVTLGSQATTTDLLRDLPSFLKLAQQRQKSEETEVALAYYHKIVTEATKLQKSEEIEIKPESVNQLTTLQTDAETGMLEILKAQLLPNLESSLQQKQIGNLLPESNLLDYENQYSEGALKTTYTLLLTSQGANADANQDGEINSTEEANRLPCELLAEIERLWRQYTDNHCGFYGDNSFYQASNCEPLQGRTLTEKVIFGNYELIGDRLKSCKIAPSNADVYQ